MFEFGFDLRVMFEIFGVLNFPLFVLVVVYGRIVYISEMFVICIVANTIV